MVWDYQPHTFPCCNHRYILGMLHPGFISVSLFQLWQVGISLETYLGICQLVGVVRVMYLLRMAEITSGSSFEPNNLTDQKLGYV